MEVATDKHPIECPICTSRSSAEFKKILGVKEIDLDIYMRRPSEIHRMEKISQIVKATQPEHEKGDFIFYNNSDLAVTAIEMLAFLDFTKVDCPRCRNMLEKLQNIIVSLPVIQRNEIRGICNNCFVKLQYDLACEQCKEIKEKFAITKGISYEEQPSERVRTQSEVELYGLLLDQALPIPRHDIDIESLFHSGTELYLDIFEEKTTQVVPKIKVQDELTIDASMQLALQEKVEEEDLGPVNVRFAEEPVVVKSDESKTETVEDSEDVETREFALKMAKEKRERAMKKTLESGRRKAVNLEGVFVGGIGILKPYKHDQKDMETKKDTEPPQKDVSRKAMIFESFQKTMPVKEPETDVFVEKRFKEILRKLEAKKKQKISVRIKKREVTKPHLPVRFKYKTHIISPTESTKLLTSLERKKRSTKSRAAVKSILKHDLQETSTAKEAVSIFKKYFDKKEAVPPPVQPKAYLSKSKKKTREEDRALKVYKDILQKAEYQEKGKKIELIAKTKVTSHEEKEGFTTEISFDIKSVKGASRMRQRKKNKLAEEQKHDRISKDVIKDKRMIILKKTSKYQIGKLAEHTDAEEETHQELKINIKMKRMKSTKKKVIKEAVERKRVQSIKKRKKKEEELQDEEKESEFKFNENLDFKVHKVTPKSQTGVKSPKERGSPKKQETQITDKKEKTESSISLERLVHIQEGKPQVIEAPLVDDEEEILKKVISKSKSAASQHDIKKPLEFKKDEVKDKLVYRDYSRQKPKKFQVKVKSDPNLVGRKRIFKTKTVREILDKGDAHYKGKLKEKSIVDQDEGKKLLKIKKDRTKNLDHGDKIPKDMGKKIDVDHDDFHKTKQHKIIESLDDRKKTRKGETKEKKKEADEEDTKGEEKTVASETDITAGSLIKVKKAVISKEKIKASEKEKIEETYETYETNIEEIPSEKILKSDILVSEELLDIPVEIEVEGEEPESQFQIQEQFIQDHRLIDAKKQATEAKKNKMGAQSAPESPDSISETEEKSKTQMIEDDKIKTADELVPGSVDAPDEKDVRTVKSSKSPTKASAFEESKETLRTEAKIIKSLLKMKSDKKQKKKLASQPMPHRTPSPIDKIKPITEEKLLPEIKEKRPRRIDDPSKAKLLLEKQQSILDVLLGNDKHRKNKESDEMQKKTDKGILDLLRRKKKSKSGFLAIVEKGKHNQASQIRTRDRILSDIEKLLLKLKPTPRRLQRATELTSTESLPSVETPERKIKSKSFGSEKEKLPEIIVGNKIYKSALAPLIEEKKKELEPILFRTSYEGTEIVGEPIVPSSEDITSYSFKKPVKVGKPKLVGKRRKGTGIISYQLSDPTFIDKGWTVLPTEKVVRKVPIYYMHLAGTDWFEHNMERGEMIRYCTDEILAKYYMNGCGRWYYKNGNIALDSYETEGIYGKRIVLYSDGEPDNQGRTYPITVLAIFDYNGNGIVFDHTGNIRLKYNQIEGVVLDPEIAPLTHWKWHNLDEFPEDLFTVPVESKLSSEDAKTVGIKASDSESEFDTVQREQDNRMLKIEFENYVKEQTSRKYRSFKKPYKYNEIRMKYFKINKYFSLKILDQRKIRLTFNSDSNSFKFDLGMILDQKKVIDTEFIDAGKVVFNGVERYPAKTESVLYLQRLRENSMRAERARHRRTQEWSAAAIARERRARHDLLPPLQRPNPEFSPQ